MMKKVKISVLVIVLLAAACFGWFVYEIQKPIILTFGMFSGSNWDVPSPYSYQIIDDVIKRFEEKHPNVQVEYISGIQKEDYTEWLSQQALKGDLPDVFMVRSQDLYTFSRLSMLENLDTYIANDSSFDQAEYFASCLEAGTYNNAQYALPYESVPTLMFVNETLLTRAGIEIPEANWSWDDFYDICEAMTQDLDGDGEIDQFGVYGYTWQEAIASNGAAIFNEEGSAATLVDERVYEAIAFARKLQQLNPSQDLSSELFDKGQVVFCPMRFSEYRTYQPYPWRIKKYTGFSWSCIPMPKGPNGENVSELDTLLMGMSATSPHKELAWEFLKMLSYDPKTQEEVFTYSQGVSVLKDVMTSDALEQYLKEASPQNSSFDLSFFQETMEHAMTNKKFQLYDQAISMADSEIRRLLNTQESIENALQVLDGKLNLLLKE